MGGKLYISLTGYGETFLQKELVPLVHGLLKLGHVINITTNGTVSNRIDELLDFDKNLLKHLHIAFSFHYLELKQRKLLDIFFNNVHFFFFFIKQEQYECINKSNLFFIFYLIIY